MFDNEIALNTFLLKYTRMSVADLVEEQFDSVPISGLHSPRWILAHLAICADMALVMLGKTKQCPAAWHVAYGPKSAGTTHEKIRPQTGELLDAINRLYPEVGVAASQASLEFLEQSHSLDLLKGTSIQTNSHLLSHLLTTHYAVHLGQLSAIRRQMGLAYLF
jgi:uncharacterized damage-inducible protein DinB